MKSVFSIFAAGCLLLINPISCLSEEELAQKYTITSAFSPQTQKGYQGEVTISGPPSSREVTWMLSDGSTYKGIGMEEGNTLGIGYAGAQSAAGVVVYKINGSVLQGKWVMLARDGSLKRGTETLTGPAKLDGVFKISDGTSTDADGASKTYSGDVTIQPKGEIYNLSWTLPAESYSGVGLRRSDLLIVSWGVGQGNGVVVYEKNGGDLKGVWTAAGMDRTGTESLSKK